MSATTSTPALKTGSGLTAAKIFIAINIVGSIIVFFLISMAIFKLRDLDRPAAFAGFFNYERSILPFSVAIYLLNLLIAVWIHRSRKHGMYYLYTLFLFIFFINLDYFWLEGKYFHVKYALINQIDDVIPTHNILAVVLNVVSIVLTLSVYVSVGRWNQWSKNRKESSLEPKS